MEEQWIRRRLPRDEECGDGSLSQLFATVACGRVRAVFSTLPETVSAVIARVGGDNTQKHKHVAAVYVLLV